MAELTTARGILTGLAVVSAGYALLGLLVAGVATYRGQPDWQRAGRILAIASPLPVVCFGLLAGAVAVSPPVVQLGIWVAVLVGAWGPVVLSPAIAVAFLLDR